MIKLENWRVYQGDLVEYFSESLYEYNFADKKENLSFKDAFFIAYGHNSDDELYRLSMDLISHNNMTQVIEESFDQVFDGEINYDSWAMVLLEKLKP